MTMPQRPPGLSASDDVLEEQDLRGAGAVVEVGLRFGVLLPAEGRVGQDHFERVGAPSNSPP